MYSCVIFIFHIWTVHDTTGRSVCLEPPYLMLDLAQSTTKHAAGILTILNVHAFFLSAA